jgi:hypothetical protein
MDIFSEQDTTSHSSIERDLWAAVLEQAIKDLDDITEHPRAVAWFRSPGDDVGSFIWICITLDMELSRVRGAILQRDYGRLAA